MTSSPADHPRSLLAWQVLRVLLAIETLLLGWVVLVSVLAAVSSSGHVMQRVSIVIMAALSLLWVLIAFIGAARGRPAWVRGSAITIHVLLFAVGTGCLQFVIGPWWIGWGFIGLAFIGFAAALLARPELVATEQAPPAAA